MVAERRPEPRKGTCKPAETRFAGPASGSPNPIRAVRGR